MFIQHARVVAMVRAKIMTEGLDTIKSIVYILFVALGTYLCMSLLIFVQARQGVALWSKSRFEMCCGLRHPGLI